MSEYWSKDDVIENAILDLQHECDELHAELARRDEVISRLKLAGNNLIQLANFGNKRAVEYTDAWGTLMKELE